MALHIAEWVRQSVTEEVKSHATTSTLLFQHIVVGLSRFVDLTFERGCAWSDTAGYHSVNCLSVDDRVQMKLDHSTSMGLT